MAQTVIPEVWSNWPHGAANSATEAVVVAVATAIRLVVGVVVAIESEPEIVGFVRGSVYRHWL